MMKVNEWRIDPDTCTLIPEDDSRERLRISPRSMDVLVYLAKRGGEVVSTEELLEQFWVPASSSDHAVHKVIASLRSALGDEAANPRFIKTLPKRGYSLIATVSEDTGERARPSSPSAREATVWARYRNTGLAAAVLVLVLAVGGAFQLLSAYRSDVAVTSASRSEGPERVAVLEPALSELASETQRQQVDALIESLAISLSRMPGLDVVADTDALAEAGQADADYVLRSTMRVVGEEMRLSVNLLGLDDGVSLYANQFSLREEDLPAIENEVVPTVVQSLSIHLDEDRFSEMLAWGTSNAGAYHHFLRGGFYNNQYNHRDWELALEHYEKAIQEDPHFVNAYLGKAKTANNMAVYSRNDRVDQLSNEVLDLSRRLGLVAPDSMALDTLKSTRIRIEGRNEWQLEQDYREQIRQGDAQGYVYARYALYLIGARLYSEANDYLTLASQSATSHQISPNEAWNFRTQTLPPAQLARVKEEQLRERPVHIGILGTAISTLAFIGEMDKARDYLERQARHDGDEVRAHLSRVLLASLSDATEDPEQYGNLHDPALLDDPDLAFNNGVLFFMQGEFETGAEYWRTLTRIDRRKLFTRLHAIELFLPDSVKRDPRYSALLEELEVGRSWQQQLMAGVAELSEYTGIQLSELSRAYYQSEELMLRNSLWGPQEWAEIEQARESHQLTHP